MFARAMASKDHPILAQIVPIRRCNLACAYCNEFDAVSAPVPLAEMRKRVDLLAALGTTIITISGGEPMLHPELDEIIRHIRRRGALATLITNGYLLTAERIEPAESRGPGLPADQHRQRDSGRDLQEEPEGAGPQAGVLGEHAQFAVTVNSVLGSPVRNPQDARTIALRARGLGLSSTVGILHDGDGQLQPLAPDHLAIYQDLLEPDQQMFSFAQYDQFSEEHLRRAGRIVGIAARAGAFLYICEDGLVHYCSQQRGHPAHTAGAIHRGRSEAGGGARKDMRALLHGIVRASDGYAR